MSRTSCAPLPPRPEIPAWPRPDEAVHTALERAWQDGSWGKYSGRHGDQLMARLAAMHAVREVLLCSSGTIAVELALRGLQVGLDDEVILAGYDFSGNFRAVESTGATPVLVDIAAHHWCLDVGRVEAAITSRTRAVVVSHLHGTLADMEQLVQLARPRGIGIVEDACQVPGAIVQGQVAGRWGDVGVLSFGGSKLLTAGRGGAVLTDRPEIAQRIRIYCERGNHAFPLSELQAAVLLPQVEQLAAQHAQRQLRVARLLSLCSPEWPVVPVVDAGEGNQPGYYKLAFRPRQPELPRAVWIEALQAAGVPCDIGFRGFWRRSGKRCRAAGSLDRSRAAAEEAILLHHPILLADLAAMDWLAAVFAAVGQELRGARQS
ncbi:MAG: DegT/DnrJ/EryC1/StrS family aminotransferase [Pirellulaceae bacterium]